MNAYLLSSWKAQSEGLEYLTTIAYAYLMGTLESSLFAILHVSGNQYGVNIPYNHVSMMLASLHCETSLAVQRAAPLLFHPSSRRIAAARLHFELRFQSHSEHSAEVWVMLPMYAGHGALPSSSPVLPSLLRVLPCAAG